MKIRRSSFFAIYLACVSLTLVACGARVTKREPPAATVAIPAAEAQLRTLHVSPRHVNFAPVAADGSGIALTVTYIFPLLQGQVFGHPGGKQAWSIGDEHRATFDLDLNDLWLNAPGAAKPLTAEARQSGVHIVPENTGILRVGTLTGDAGTRKLFPVEVGFRDPVADITLVLIYVDRPCLITGVVGTPEGRAELDVTLGSAGFHWLSYVPDGHGQVSVREHADTDSVLLIVGGPTARK